MHECTIGFLQQIWDEVSFVGVMESRDGELEFLRQLCSAPLVSTSRYAIMTYLTRMKPSKSVAS